MWLVTSPGIRVWVWEPHSVSTKATWRGAVGSEMSTMRIPSLLREEALLLDSVLLQSAVCSLFELGVSIETKTWSPRTETSPCAPGQSWKATCSTPPSVRRKIAVPS